MPSREKGAKTCLGSKARHFLLSGLSATSEELRPFPAIFRSTQASFSALQTAWRRERDSNPRYPFRYIGFQDRLFQPLTHPSAAKESLSMDGEFAAICIRILTLGPTGSRGQRFLLPPRALPSPAHSCLRAALRGPGRAATGPVHPCRGLSSVRKRPRSQ